MTIFTSTASKITHSCVTSLNVSRMNSRCPLQICTQVYWLLVKRYVQHKSTEISGRNTLIASRLSRLLKVIKSKKLHGSIGYFQFYSVFNFHIISVSVATSVQFHTSPFQPRAGSGVVRMDPLRFLAGCRTRRLNQG